MSSAEVVRSATIRRVVPAGRVAATAAVVGLLLDPGELGVRLTRAILFAEKALGHGSPLSQAGQSADAIHNTYPVVGSQGERAILPRNVNGRTRAECRIVAAQSVKRAEVAGANVWHTNRSTFRACRSAHVPGDQAEHTNSSRCGTATPGCQGKLTKKPTDCMFMQLFMVSRSPWLWIAFQIRFIV